MADKRIGLVIGNNYPNSDKTLKYAVADAQKIKEILENKDICGFDEVQYYPDKEMREVSIAVNRILKEADDDFVFIYYSGHGKKDHKNKLCLLFKDTLDDVLSATSLSFDYIQNCLDFPNKKSVVIVLDCCYSGVAGIRDAETDVMEALKKHTGSGTIILTSTGSTGSPTAREDDNLGHGIFTHYLIEGLEKGYADKDDSGLTTIDELFEYAYNKTTENSKQSPKKEGRIEGTFNIGSNPRKIKEKEYKSKSEKLVKEFGALLPSRITNESLTILRKYYKNSSSLEQVDSTILDYLDSFLKNDLLPEERTENIQNYIEIVQHLKGFCINDCMNERQKKPTEVKHNLTKHPEEEEKARELKEQDRLGSQSEKAIKLELEVEEKTKEEFNIGNAKICEEAENFDIKETFTSPFIEMEFVLIHSGKFMMGSTGEESRYINECPVHEVIVKNSFYFGKYLVTQKQWEQVMGNNPSQFKNKDRPVESISWYAVQKFIKKLNEKEATDKYRLPSEAEWEYACRAGSQTMYSYGENKSELNEYAWYAENSGSETHTVGKKKPNPWGLYDMHGNVWEWVQDKWHENFNGAPTDGSAWEDGDNLCRVTRGGSWINYPGAFRSACRLKAPPEHSINLLGFRLLREL